MVSRRLYVEHSIRWASNLVIAHVWWEKLRLNILTPSVFDDDLRLFELRELTTSRSSNFSRMGRRGGGKRGGDRVSKACLLQSWRLLLTQASGAGAKVLEHNVLSGLTMKNQSRPTPDSRNTTTSWESLKMSKRKNFGPLFGASSQIAFASPDRKGMYHDHYLSTAS